MRTADSSAGRLRIMHLVRSDRFAGVEQFVLRLALAQADAGHRVHVAGGAEGSLRDELAAGGATWEPVRTVWDLCRAVRRRGSGADVVNTHMTDADAVAALMLPRHGPALVSTRHFARARRRLGPLRVDSAVQTRIDAEISISTAVAAAVGVPSTVVHSGVPPAPSSTGSASQRILMAQRLQPEKRPQLGILAFAHSGLAARGWTLDIAGDGPLRAECRRLIDQHGVGESVRLLGFRGDVPDLLASSAIFLAPCPIEGLGLAVLEAMAAGVAPVVADAAGHRDLIEGLDARAGFTADDERDAAEALRALADDDAGRERLAAAARDRARTEFSIERQAECTDVVYRTAIGRRRR